MSIDELFAENKIPEILTSLENINFELKNVTHPLKLIFNPTEKKKQELFERVRELRIEAEELTNKMKESEDNKDLKVIRQITERVKQIVNEKLDIQKELIKIKSLK